jgi:hypothetical protein
MRSLGNGTASQQDSEQVASMSGPATVSFLELAMETNTLWCSLCRELDLEPLRT